VAPKEGSKEMRAIIAYMEHVSRAVPKGAQVSGVGFVRLPPPDLEPSEARGEAVYTAKCAACHQLNGQGLRGPDGEAIFPPIWGHASFNIAAGMARLNTAAGFVYANMPKGQDMSLTPQDAYDVALYLTHKDHDDFAKKSADWPKGGKPEDARY
jgi:thiosulfate dehydrogenase